MNVDLEAIARRGRCDVTSLRAALPLLEQGYTPPFLARYRRDELGGVDEASLWGLAHALQTQKSIEQRREELHQVWEQTTLADPAIGLAVRKSNSKRMLDRLGRRLKLEIAEAASPGTRLAVRVMNPQRGDADDLLELAKSLEGIDEPETAVQELDEAIARRLTGDPRVIGAAVRWLAKNAKIYISRISDPHLGGDEEDHASDDSVGDDDHHDHGVDAHHQELSGDDATSEDATSEDSSSTGDEADASEASSVPKTLAVSDAPAGDSVAESTTVLVQEATAEIQTGDEAERSNGGTEEVAETETAAESIAAETTTDAAETTTDDVVADAASDLPATLADATPPSSETQPATPKASNAKSATSKKAGKRSGKPDASKKPKRISPRQRRRRWLISVLQPLAGKHILASKLGAFQVLMLSRALRSQVAECAFEYDASKLVAEIQHAAAGLSRTHGERLSEIALRYEASIREASEAAWWDELQEQASTRLVGIAGEHLRTAINRGSIDAKVVLAIDAVGPRTAASTVVSADGRVLHSEDLPCQLSATLRSQAVSRMGELIHMYGVDLIVISNGPARRASMVAVSDLLAQSPEQSLRWTLADRSGADAYAGSATADQEMRSTPRRFRAAAWLAFSVLRPAQALAKVDPLKLRLASFQRELTDEALVETLSDVMVSGASRGGVDVNSAPLPWLSRLPGVGDAIAKKIDQRRREKLFASRADLESGVEWPGTAETRQALPFLRVFGSDEPLDGTLIHPEDYILARKLANALSIEMPPNAPPGYVTPSYEDESPVASELEPAAPSEVSEEEKPEPEFAASALLETSDSNASASEDASVGTAELTSAEATSTETPGETPGEAPAAESSDDAAVVAAADEATGPEASSTDETAADETAADDAPPESPTASTATETVATVSARQPFPERAKIEKCVKEWQIGPKRTHQIVSWLCDPFGDSDSEGATPAVLSSMPSLSTLKPGDQVIGVVVGVMPFGVFVELAPDCSGLIHVSKVSEAYVEDLHEAVQVGDVITAWVSRIDDKRRRVALSAIAPEREEALEQERLQREERPRGPHQRRGDGPPRSARPSSPAHGEQRGGAEPRPGGRSGGRSGAAASTGGGNREQGGRAEQGGRSRDGQTRGDRQGGDRQGGGGRDGGRRDGGRRDGGRRDGGGRAPRERRLESYRVESTTPKTAPITEAMEKGDEPLRSFGDLLQFYSKKDPKAPPEPKQQSKKVAEKSEKSEDSTNEAPVTQVSGSVGSDSPATDPPSQSSAEPRTQESPTQETPTQETQTREPETTTPETTDAPTT